VDEISPRRPQDPPWRSRTAHRTSDPGAMEALHRGRLARGWSMTAAAEHSGVSRPMISQLERGQRRPSRPLAEALISAYRLTGPEADAVRSIALEWVGRDSPFRTGVSPAGESWETSWDTEGNETRRHVGPAQHRADPGTGRATGRPAATAEDWIQWARRKSEGAQGAQGAPNG
jgi:transcriptional regulator with XRE-family HTH domain